MARQRTGLRAPTADAVAAVPRVERPGPWHRAVRVDHRQPWHFSSRADNPAPGRFDLEAPSGTCYLAASPGGAILEVCAEPDAEDPAPPTSRQIARLRVWSGELDDGRGIADTTVASTPRLTLELSTIVPYGLAHDWADALAADGARGLCYRARFAQQSALALFGPRGVPNPEDPSDPRRAGDLAPTPASDHARDLPPAMRPVAVGAVEDFTPAPPPGDLGGEG